jgi:hypothetical protein
LVNLCDISSSPIFGLISPDEHIYSHKVID